MSNLELDQLNMDQQPDLELDQLDMDQQRESGESASPLMVQSASPLMVQELDQDDKDGSKIVEQEEAMGGYISGLSQPNGSGDTEPVIQKDNRSSDGVPGDPDSRSIGSSKKSGPKTTRQKLMDILYSQEFQILVIVLVVVDCILVVGELILDFSALEDNQCPPPNGNESETAHHEEVEDASHQTSNSDHEEKVNAALVLHYMSLTILSIFMVELIFKMGVLQKEFFHHKLEIFDAFVIVTSFILDIMALVYEEAFAALELLVLLRLWRIVRVVNGVIVSVETKAEKHIEHHKELQEEAEQELEKYRQYSQAQEKEIELLREEFKKHGISLDETLIPRSEKPIEVDKPEIGILVSQVNDILGDVHNEKKGHFSSNGETNQSNFSKSDKNLINTESSSSTTPGEKQNEYANDGSEC